jgi:uncharacterized protein YndB with AHSA1/START domain
MNDNIAATGAQSAGPEIVITREFNAPRDLVWKSWTDPEHLKNWWGPKAFKMLVCNVDLRPGGLFHYCMQSPQAAEMWGKFVYREIAEPERLVFVNSFSDKDAGTTRNPWMPTGPLEVLNQLALAEKEARTMLSLRGSPINATDEELKAFAAGAESMQKGFAGTFAQLDEYLAKM